MRRIAIGDPAAVPAGVYAKEYLTRAGIWTALQPKLVPTGSVRLALAAVEAGSVDAAIVYRTDAAVAKRSRLAWLVPRRRRDRGSSTRRSRCATRPMPTGAARFSGFLRSPEAAALMRRAGFTPPRPAASIRDDQRVGARGLHRRDRPCRDGADAGSWRRAGMAAGAQDFRGKTLVETAVSLPLVLPPVATGLLLLWVFGRRGPLGSLSAPSASRWSSRRPRWCWR